MKTDELYEEIRSAMGLMNSRDSEMLFLMSLKKVVNDLNRKLKETIVAPTSISATDIGFEDYCDNTFFPGVKFYMQRDGSFAQDPDAESKAFYDQELRSVIGPAITANSSFKIRNQADD